MAAIGTSGNNTYNQTYNTNNITYYLNGSMNNETIYNMINLVSDNDTNTWNSNVSINHYLNTYFANLTQIMNNVTILNYVTDNYITYYSSNDSIIDYVNSSGHIIDWNSSGYIKDWTVAGDGIGNSNETLWAMFANITNIVNNETIFDIINSITTNGTTYYLMNNETILAYVQDNYVTYYSSNASILDYMQLNYVTHYSNNETILDVANASGLIINQTQFFTDTYNTTTEMQEAINVTGYFYNIDVLWSNLLSIPSYVKDWTNDLLTINNTIMNNDTVADVAQASISGGSGIVYDTSTGIILTTSTNGTGTSNAMNNQTIANALFNSTIVRPIELITINNTISNNQTIQNTANESGYIKDWNESGYIIDQSSSGDGTGNSNATLWDMFANLTQIQNNETILNVANASGLIINQTEFFTDTSMNNQTISNLIDNGSIIREVNGSWVIDNQVINSNESINNFIDNGSIVRNVNESFVRNLLSGITGIVYDSSTGQILATAKNFTEVENDSIKDFNREEYMNISGGTFTDTIEIDKGCLSGGTTIAKDYICTQYGLFLYGFNRTEVFYFDLNVTGNIDAYSNFTIYDDILNENVKIKLSNNGTAYIGNNLLVNGEIVASNIAYSNQIQNNDTILTVGDSRYMNITGGDFTGGINGTDASFSGDVGIGTSSPTKKLHLEESSSGSEVIQLLLKNPNSVPDTASAIGFTSYDGSAITGKIENNNLGYGVYDMRFSTYSNDDIMTLKKGNVGIGTTTPDSTLNVEGDVNLSTNRFSFVVDDDGFKFYDGIDNYDYAQINCYDGDGENLCEFNSGLYVSSGTTYIAGAIYARGTIISNDDEEDFTIAMERGLNWQIDSDNGDETDDEFIWSIGGTTYGAGTELMRLTEDGNLGVGAPTPGARLDVATAASGVTLQVGRGSGSPNIKANTDNYGYLLMDSTGGNAGLNWYVSDDVILANGGGDVGIGTTSPTSKLTVIDSGNVIGLNSTVTGAYMGNNYAGFFEATGTINSAVYGIYAKASTYADMGTSYSGFFDGAPLVACNGACTTPSYATAAGEIYAEGDLETDGNLYVLGTEHIFDTTTSLSVAGDILLTGSGDDINFVDANTRIRESSNDLYLEADDEIRINPDGDLWFAPAGDQVRVGADNSNVDLIIDDGGLTVSSGAVAPSTATDGNVEIEDGAVCIGDGGCTPDASDGTLCVSGGDCNTITSVNGAGDIYASDTINAGGKICGNRFAVKIYNGHANQDTGTEYATYLTSLEVEGITITCIDCMTYSGGAATCATDSNNWEDCWFKTTC